MEHCTRRWENDIKTDIIISRNKKTNKLKIINHSLELVRVLFNLKIVRVCVLPFVNLQNVPYI